MSADTFVSALFIITAVVAAGILINAVYPIVWTSASTFSSSAHETDTRMRTDCKSVTTCAAADPSNRVDIYLKNVWLNPISYSERQSGDVFFGETSRFTRLAYTTSGSPSSEHWTFEGYDSSESSYDLNTNGYWDTGETLHIIAVPKYVIDTGDIVYFQFVLTNGVLRTAQFTTS